MRAHGWYKCLVIALGTGAALLSASPVHAQCWCNKPRYTTCCPAPCGVAEPAAPAAPMPTPLPPLPKVGEEPAPSTPPAVEGMAAAAPTPSPYDSGDLGA